MKRAKEVTLICAINVISVIYIFNAPHLVGASETVSPKEARALYRQNCARCHGLDGRGETELGKSLNAPDLTDAAWRAKISAKRMSESIADGREEMPAFGKKLSRAQIAALVAYVRSLKQ
jgi:cbb3-type cytochrome c oxidase subunit III